MKGYRKPSGVYIEVQDTTPVNDSLVEVALRPEDHVFTDTWQSDPMNPSVCWRPKNASEIDAEKDVVANISKIDPWLKAYALCLNDGTIVPGSNMTPAQLKAAVKAKL